MVFGSPPWVLTHFRPGPGSQGGDLTAASARPRASIAPGPVASQGLQVRAVIRTSAFPHFSSHATGGRLTELDEIVDSEQKLHLLGDGLYGGGPILLIRPRDGLGVLVARVQEGAHDDVAQVPTEVREVPVACGRRNSPAWQPALGTACGPPTCGISKYEGAMPLG